MSDRLIGLLLLLLCGVMWSQTYTIRTPAFAQFEQLDSAFFPRLVLVGLAICSAFMLARGSGRLVSAEGGAAVGRWTRENVRVLISLAMFAVYLLSMPLFGYVPTTAVYLMVMQLFLRPRGLLGTAVVVVLSALAAYGLALVFTQFLHVVLPRGEF